MSGTPSRGRWVAVVAVGLLLLVAAWWASRPGPPASAPGRSETKEAKVERRLPRPSAGTVAASQEEVGEPVVEAMGALARAEGRGHLRCPIGEVVTGPVTAKGLVRARVTAGVLVAQVDEPEGTAAVYAQVTSGPKLEAVELPDGQLAFTPDAEEGAGAEDDASLPRAHVSWTGATPGALGTCRVTDVEPVEFVVAAADGGASFGATTDGACAVLLTRSSLPESRYRVRGERGVPCEVTLHRSEAAEEAGGPQVVLQGSVWIADPRADGTWLVSSWSAPEPEGAEAADDKEGEEADEPPGSPWEEALAREDLSPAARDVLLGWQEDEFQQADAIGQGWKQLESDLKAAPADP